MFFIQYRIFVDECICYECLYKAKFRSCTKLIIKSRLLLHLYKDLEDKELFGFCNFKSIRTTRYFVHRLVIHCPSLLSRGGRGAAELGVRGKSFQDFNGAPMLSAPKTLKNIFQGKIKPRITS